MGAPTGPLTASQQQEAATRLEAHIEELLETLGAAAKADKPSVVPERNKDAPGELKARRTGSKVAGT